MNIKFMKITNIKKINFQKSKLEILVHQMRWEMTFEVYNY